VGRLHQGCVVDRVRWRAVVLVRWDTRLAKRLDLHGRVCDRQPRGDAVVGVARSRITQRAQGGPFPKGQAFWDKVFMAFIIVVWFGWLVLMALDAKRWNLSQMPEALNYVGAVLIPIGFFIVRLTFRENSFAAPVVKIQEERGQRVISTGPYRIVRHPMYAGATLYMIGMPLLLGSWLGLLVLPLILGALSVRIFIEEAVLRKGLRGYGDYAARVRYRLIPGVW